MSKKLKPVPKFKTEAEERAFWESSDSANYMDWSKAERAVLQNLKPTIDSISIKLKE